MANVINATSTGNGGLVSTGDDSGILNIQTNETTAITVDASQIVTLSSASNPSLIVNRTASTGDAGLSFQSTGTGVSSLTGLYGGGLRFGTGSGDTERMRILSDGAVIVGATSNPGGGFSQFVVSGPDTVAINNTTAGTGSATAVYFKRNATGTGSITVTGSATAYNTSSDYRLKDNVQPMTGALAKVALLKPVTYKWKVDGSDGEGFIAHELAEVKPDCVSGDKDAVNVDGNPVYQGIDTSFLVATLTAALQETKALLDTQAETINALTARIVALEGQ